MAAFVDHRELHVAWIFRGLTRITARTNDHGHLAVPRDLGRCEVEMTVEPAEGELFARLQRASTQQGRTGHQQQGIRASQDHRRDAGASRDDAPTA